MSFIYKLYCDDAKQYIIGDRALDLAKEVDDALQALDRDAILSPSEDWFQVTVDKVCERTAFKPVVAGDEIDVERYYWDEFHRREEEETSEGATRDNSQ